ncbi:MAG: hypothetical protein J6I49_09305 [Bacteroidales bacterium]|nr:hypothetical protein [Bacteroidales bacterium]
MKKQTLFRKLAMSIALATCLSASAQYYCSAELDASALHTPYPSKTITRPWNFQYAITLHHDQNGSRISMVSLDSFTNTFSSQQPPSTPVIYTDIFWRMHVQDIQVLNNTLYICGYYIDSSKTAPYKGFVSMLSLPLRIRNLMMPTMPIRKFQLVRSINKMVLRQVSPNRVDIVGLCNINGSPYDVQSDGIVRITNVNGSGMSVNYANLPSYEKAGDIHLFGDSTIIITGSDVSSGFSRISIRKYNPSQLASSSSPHPKSCFMSGANDINGFTYSCKVNDQTLAVSYVHVDDTSANWARVRLFDVATLNNTKSIEFPICSKQEPLTMAPGTSLQPSFTLLHSDMAKEECGFISEVFTIKSNLSSVWCSRFDSINYTSAANVLTIDTIGLKQDITMYNGGDRYYLRNDRYTLPTVWNKGPVFCYDEYFLGRKAISNLSKQTLNTPHIWFSIYPMAPVLSGYYSMQKFLSASCYSYPQPIKPVPFP